MSKMSDQIKARQSTPQAVLYPDALERYRRMVKRLQGPLFAHPLSRREEILLHAAIGMCNEAGEIMEIVNRTLHYGETPDAVHLLEEVGDMFHYIMYLMIEYDWTLEDIMQANMDKLAKRYPDGFTTKAALERKDKKGDIK